MQAEKQTQSDNVYHHALFFLDPENDYHADGRVNHYCTQACCLKAFHLLTEAGKHCSHQGTCTDSIEGTLCANCGIPLDAVGGNQSVVDLFVLAHQKLFSTFPGTFYQGDITGHGSEWRTELVLDYCPSDESEESDNEYALVFSIRRQLPWPHDVN